jgi:hypothetical protein
MLQHLLVRWTLDVMHYEMNIAKNFLKTITGKKDTMKVRHDLQRQGLRRHLWLVPNPRRGGKMLKPMAPYVLSDREFEVFASTLESVKMPSGMSPISGSTFVVKSMAPSNLMITTCSSRTCSH